MDPVVVDYEEFEHLEGESVGISLFHAHSQLTEPMKGRLDGKALYTMILSGPRGAPRRSYFGSTGGTKDGSSFSDCVSTSKRYGAALSFSR